MCGIVGYIGKKEKTLPVLIAGLKNLEYRGYDSAGIAYTNNNKIKIIKSKGKIKTLEELIDFNVNTNMGIGHTRWATHGKPNKINAHPHKYGHITLIHNGIIENADMLKQDLINKGIIFESDTDSEVAAVILNIIYEECLDMKKAISKLMTIINGSYALGIICDEDINNLYCVKKESPLIIGIGDGETFIASDVPAIKKETKNYIFLNDLEFAVINKNEIHIYDKNGNEVKHDIKTIDDNEEDALIDGFPHFMLKEINEQPNVIDNLYMYYINNIENIKKELPNFNKYKHIDIVACGSAYHAGLVGKHYIEKIGNIPVTVSLASEYRYEKHFPSKNNLVILVSQSGETADTLACLKLAKTYNMDTLAIVNVYHSSIARHADYVFYTRAGYEIAVATTKAYSAQIISFIILSLVISNQGIDVRKYQKELPYWKKAMHELINNNYKEVVALLKKNEKIFFIGRQIDYALAMEGSLKLKEITYLLSVCFAAGELKHGTISLIDKDCPVIAIVTDNNIADKTFSNIKEVKARGAKVILIISEELDNEFDFADYKIIIPNINELVNPILTIIPLQKIAYEVALALERDIDKPRNLAKSVTVE